MMKYIISLKEYLWVLISTVGFIWLSYPDSKCVEEMIKELKLDHDKPSDNLKENYDLAKISFEEIKHLTEYEDEKANRILTAVAFLSALAGMVFVSLIPKTLNGGLIPFQELHWSQLLFYLSFSMFIITLVLGAIGVVGSIEPRFNLGSINGNSFLFAPLVLKKKPSEWMRSFKDNNNDYLKNEFAKCYVMESYLIAEKIKNKLKYLEPSVKTIRLSIIILIVWIICTGIMLYASPVKILSKKPEIIEVCNCSVVV